MRTYPRNTKADNVKANFDDGAATFFASADTYGVDNTWVLLEEAAAAAAAPTNPVPTAVNQGEG